MALLKGKFVSLDEAIQSNNDPSDSKDLSRKSYVDSKAASEAAAAVAAIDLSAKADLVGGKVPSTQLPSYVDDVIELADYASLPGSGETGKIYVTIDNNKVYRWSGSAYIEIVASPGSTDAVPEGSTNLYYTDARAKAAAISDAIVDGVTDQGPSQNAVFDALALKQASLGTGTTSQYLRGDLTWQEIVLSYPVAQVKHVSKNGVDASADGSEEKPYLTIAAAMTAITDATPTKRYVIRVAAGNYTEASMSLKANVFVIGESKESVRITGAVSMNADWNQVSANDCRGGFSMVSLLSAADFNWTTVTSPAGKLYFNEVVFGSTLALNGYNNAIAQAQFNACVIFGNMTISGINVGVFTNNIAYGNITLNQHPNGGMATILAATGGSCSGTLSFVTTVNDFNRRCSGFLKSFYCENLIINGASSYADVDIVSQGKSSTQKLNGGTLVALTPKVSHDLETQMLKPLSNNAHNLGDWGKQWFFNFAYVHASAGTDMYILSAMENYDPAGDSSGKSIYITPDGYGLQTNVSGGNVEIETAAVSGTGVRGKVKINARELDMTLAKITSVADPTANQDAATKKYVDDGLSGKQASLGTGTTSQYLRGDLTWATVPAALSPKKETFVLTSTDLSNAYLDCAFQAAADSMLLMTGGIPHQEGASEDYTLSVVGGVTRISINAGLLAKLSAGDRIYVMYQK